jgi:phage-related holin
MLLLLKLSFTALFALLLAFVKRYIYADFNFLISLSVIVAIDTALGFSLAWRQKRITIRGGFGKLFTKMLIYGCILIVTHVVTSIEIRGKALEVFNWFPMLAYGALLAAETLSILVNINKIKPGLITAAIMKRFADFNDAGKPITQ